MSQTGMWGRRATRDPHKGLSSEAERLLDETYLTNGVVLGKPADLPFSNHVHCFVPRDRSQCSVYGSEPLTGHYPLFYETMVLLDSVVQVRTGSTPAPRTQLSGTSEFVDHRWISGMAIHIDNAGSNPTRQSKLQETFGRNAISVRREQEIDCVTG